MRKFLIPIAAAASTLPFAAPAAAQYAPWAPPVYQYNPYNYGYGFNGGNFARSMESRVQRIRMDIRVMHDRRILSRGEARRLDRQAENLQRRIFRATRYGKIAAGASWEGEYGSITDPAIRAFWDKTSPYQNLRKDGAYPVPFIFTTTKDDRVGPQHARKFAARMEEYGLPFYYYENTEGGHSAGANLRQLAHTNALEMIYLTRKLMDPAEPQ